MAPGTNRVRVTSQAFAGLLPVLQSLWRLQLCLPFFVTCQTTSTSTSQSIASLSSPAFNHSEHPSRRRCASGTDHQLPKAHVRLPSALNSIIDRISPGSSLFILESPALSPFINCQQAGLRLAIPRPNSQRPTTRAPFPFIRSPTAHEPPGRPCAGAKPKPK
jgi:hypothetical protein